jgi:hypothetical protein
MQFFKIVLLTIVAAVLYGLVHDQITVRICPEYFTVFHPRIMDTENLTLIALGWGVVATWWMGAGIGLVLALSARWGRWPRQTWRQLVRPVSVLLAVMAGFAVLGGIAGYHHTGAPAFVAAEIPVSMYRRFMADWGAHIASYASGFFGGMGVCIITLFKRYRTASITESPSSRFRG